MVNLKVIVSPSEDTWNVEITNIEETKTIAMLKINKMIDDDKEQLMERTFSHQYVIVRTPIPTFEYNEFILTPR